MPADKPIHQVEIKPPQTPMLQTHKLHHLDFKGFLTALSQDTLNPEIIALLRYIQATLQPNLGLSRVARQQHETYAPLHIDLFAPTVSKSKASQLTHTLDEREHFSAIVSHKGVAGRARIRICLETPFRRVTLKFYPDNTVEAELILNWDAIYKDLKSDSHETPLRGFTAWQRFSEISFFLSRSVNKVLSHMSKHLPQLAAYDEASYFKDHKPIGLELKAPNLLDVPEGVNFALTIKRSLFKAHNAYDQHPHKRHAILVVIEMDTPLMGTVRKLAPAMCDKRGDLCVPLQGAFNEARVMEIFHVDHESSALHTWPLRTANSPLCVTKLQQADTPEVSELALLQKTGKTDFTHKLSTAPMVRGSDVHARRYWASFMANSEKTEKNPVIYSEMITPAHMMMSEMPASDKAGFDVADAILYSVDSESSFRRALFSLKELELAKTFVIQITVPHTLPSKEDEAFFWGENGENIGRTTILSTLLLLKLIPEKFYPKLRLAINMCCPAPRVEEIGGGFGLRKHPTHLESIGKALHSIFPWLPFEFKTLLPAQIDKGGDEAAAKIRPHAFSEGAYRHLAKRVTATGADRLVAQGKVRNDETYFLNESLIPFSGLIKGGYSGSVVSLSTADLSSLGYHPDGVHTSVEHVLSKVRASSSLEDRKHFEVMLGRVLLGSTWLLLGHYASDSEIMLHTMLNAFLAREITLGQGRFGLEIMKIGVFYGVRHLTTYEGYADKLIESIVAATTQDEIIDILYDAYETYTPSSVNDGYASNRLKVGDAQSDKSMLAYLKEAVSVRSSRDDKIKRKYPLSKGEKTVSQALSTFFWVNKAKERFKQGLERVHLDDDETQLDCDQTAPPQRA